MAIRNVKELKVELLCNGARIAAMNTRDAGDIGSSGIGGSGGKVPGRKAGAGPAAGGAFVFGGTVANVPTMSWFVRRSPFFVVEENGRFYLKRIKNESAEPRVKEASEKQACVVEEVSVKNGGVEGVGVDAERRGAEGGESEGEVICELRFPHPRFYDMRTADGIPYWKIALLHGVNCLATTTIQTCVYWNTPKRCKFCAIEVSLRENATIAKKKPEDVAEVAVAAVKLNGVTHVTLTTGTTATPDKGINHLLAVAKAIKDAVNLPIHVQFEPPKDLRTMDRLYDAVDTVGIHIESFDRGVLREVAPAKAEIFEKFFDAWKHAVKLFGENQVSSYVIVGLGESDDSVIEGSRKLAEMGVYPYVVPLRPIPGSQMEHEMPPSADRMKRLYTEIAEILHETGLSWRKSKAGCVRCRACSALPDYELSILP